MAKPYFNDAITGNGRMLACLTNEGELVRLYWPHIDSQQHMEKILTCIFDYKRETGAFWVEEGNQAVSQRYIGDTNIIETILSNHERNLTIKVTDFCMENMDILIRNYEIANDGTETFNLGIAVASHIISSNHDTGNTLFDFSTDALVQYRRGQYMSISSEYPVRQFQLGNNPFGAVWDGNLNGTDSIGMSADGALSWHIGAVGPGESRSISVRICFAASINAVKKMTYNISQIPYIRLYEDTIKYWSGLFSAYKRIETGNDKVDTLYKRSLLVFKLMSDKSTGGLLAAPEVDEYFTRCGRYAYCWGRDAAFITEALDCVGMHDEVDRFYEWAVHVQDPDGFWYQRYNMDGNLAPSWGIQIDETGTLLWGMLNHYRYLRDTSFLNRMWESITMAMDFISGFIDKETNLPKPSFDLWEERNGEHTYSSAAVYGGIKAAAEIGGILNKDEALIKNWHRLAEVIKKAMMEKLWDEKKGRFLRSIRTKLNAFGPEPSDNTIRITINGKGCTIDVSKEDPSIDISLLGVCIPFNVLDAHDPKVVKTVEAIENILTCHEAGGIMRYENDNYAGGNPWILTTLWMALYYLEKGEPEKAQKYFDWAVEGTTALGLLPEQIGKHDGKPAWIIPLTWSHAMFVLTLSKLFG